MRETPHDRYVAAGRCSSIHNKTWCEARAGHSGPHSAPYLLPDGSYSGIEWKRDD